MAKLKAVFISVYVTFVMAASAYGIWRAVEGPRWPWIGAVLTTLPAALFFIRVYARGNVARTSARMPVIVGLAILGLAISAGSCIVGSCSTTALLLCAVGLGALFAYSYWYSTLARGRNELLRVGQALPDFQLQTEDAEPVHSSSFLGKPLLMLFYRGNWCPLCMAQVREVAAQYRAFAARGIQVVLVSPQPHAYTRKLAARFDVPFQFLVDPGQHAAKQLGIFAKDGLPAGLQVLGYDSDTVWPTVLITDAQGEILFVDLTDNYRVRPEPSSFFAVFDRTDGTPR
jgi:peroxiredoxin